METTPPQPWPAQPWIVMTTLSRAEEADALARTLVQEGLVACGQVLPGIRSHYVWEGKMCMEDESLLLLKTDAGLWRALEERLGQLHPYEVPEILALGCEAWSAAYGAWMSRQVQPPPG